MNIVLFGQDGDTALTAASCKGRSDVVKLLLAYPGVDVNVQNKVNFSRKSEYVSMDLTKILTFHLVRMDGRPSWMQLRVVNWN